MPESEVRRVRIDDETWRAYAETVGDGGRSADIRAYILWRVNHPKTPLPGSKLGPVQRIRNTRTTVVRDKRRNVTGDS